MTKIPFNEAKHGNKLSLQCLLLSIEGFHLLLYLIQYLNRTILRVHFQGITNIIESA